MLAASNADRATSRDRVESTRFGMTVHRTSVGREYASNCGRWRRSISVVFGRCAGGEKPRGVEYRRDRSSAGSVRSGSLRRCTGSREHQSDHHHVSESIPARQRPLPRQRRVRKRPDAGRRATALRRGVLRGRRIERSASGSSGRAPRGQHLRDGVRHVVQRPSRRRA